MLFFAPPARAARLTVNTVATAEILRDAALHVRVEDHSQVVRRGPAGNGTVVFDVPVGLYTISVDEAGYWSPRASVYVPADGLVHHLPVYRSATLVGRVNAADGEARAASVNVRFIIADAPGAPSGETTCAIENDRWACTVPAARLDLSVKAPGFIARHRFDVDAARTPVDFGTIELRRGASLVGSVAFAGKSRHSLKNAVVRLQRRKQARSYTAEDESRLPEAEVRTNRRGFFHFDGIAPGDYTVAAALQEWSSAEQHVRIMANLEAELRDPLLLETTHDLELTVQPRHDPYGRRWLAYVQRETNVESTLTTERNDRVSDDGRVMFRGLPPGKYVVQLRSERGDDWTERRIEVPRERFLHVTIDRTFLSGTVSLAGEPLEAMLTFVGEGFSVAARSTAEGRYAVFLPVKEPATLQELRVSSELPSVQRVLQRVSLHDAGAARRRLDIELPGSELAGQVVDRSGRFVVPALVRIESLTDGTSEELQAREDGTFEVHGLPPGRVRVRALGPRSASPATEIEVSSKERAFVQLTVEPQNRVSGRVMSAAGPVAGAVVYVLPVPAGAYVVPRTATDAEGRFDTALPAGVADVDVFIAPPGFAARLFRTRIPDTGSLIVPVSHVSGALIVRFERSPDDAPEVLPFLRHAGATANLGLFVRPGSGPVDEGKQRMLRISDLEPGAYEVCRKRDQPPCAPVVVAPFGVSTVTLP